MRSKDSLVGPPVLRFQNVKQLNGCLQQAILKLQEHLHDSLHPNKEEYFLLEGSDILLLIRATQFTELRAERG